MTAAPAVTLNKCQSMGGTFCFSVQHDFPNKRNAEVLIIATLHDTYDPRASRSTSLKDVITIGTYDNQNIQLYKAGNYHSR